MPFNTEDQKQPPFINGVMDLTEEEIFIVKERLEEVAEGFVPDDFTPEINTFYLTATYNQKFPEETINGDTCVMCMSYEPPVEEPTEEEPTEEPTEEELTEETNEEELTQEELDAEEPTEEPQEENQEEVDPEATEEV
jgi:hypothetical protein